jgi:hypothetical protein
VIRRVLVAAVLIASALALSGPAHAGDGVYPFDCGFVLDPPVIATDGTIHIIGSGFEPGSEVDFFIDGVFLGTAEVDDDADGNIDVTFPLPAGFNVDGQFTITTECPSGNVASNVLIVGQGVVTTTTPLPATGSDSTGGLTRLAVGLVGVGGLVLLLTRRRATQHATVKVSS